MARVSARADQRNSTAPEVFPEQQLELAEGLRQHHLDLTPADVLRQRSHGHGRNEEEEDPRQRVEHRPQGGGVGEVSLAEEEEPVDREEHDQQDVTGGEIEERLELAARDGPDAHQTGSC